MKLILFLLLIPASYAQVSPECRELTSIVQHYEKTLQWKTVAPEDENKNPDPQGLCPQGIVHKDHPLFTSTDLGLLEKVECQNLAAIEQKINKLENEQGLLLGFHKLKADLAANKKAAATPDEKNAKRAALSFVDGLKTAKTLEQLLQNGDGNLLKAMQNVAPKERDTAAKFRAIVKAMCANNKTTGACNEKAFTPNDAAVAAINELLQDTALVPAQIQTWKKALSIQKVGAAKDSKYSFIQMAEELESKSSDIFQGNLKIDREQLRAIKSLPDFKDGGLGLSHLKGDIKAYELMQDYKFHVGDLKKRQEFETQSKVLNFWSDLKDSRDLLLGLNSSEMDACNSVKMGLESALNCWEGVKRVKDKLPPGKRSDFNDLNEALEVSQKYLAHLARTHDTCLEVPVTEELKARGELPKECLEAFGATDQRLSALSNELKVLNAVKAKIGDQNQDLMKLRNAALVKLAALPNCVGKEQNDLQCSYDGAAISMTAELLTSHIQNLDLMVTKTAGAAPDIKDLCGDKERKFYKKDVICAEPKAAPKDPVVSDKKKDEEFEAPTDAPSGGSGSMRSATLAGVGNVLSSALTTLFTQPNYSNYYPQVNPYMYNYSPYNSGLPVMGISDQILFNARFYGGYGYYMPTAGYQPYTAFGTSLSSYTPYSTSRSAYFTSL